MSPKQELILTLDTACTLLKAGDAPAVRLAQLHGLIDHARALALRVGEVSKPRGKRDAIPAEEVPL